MNTTSTRKTPKTDSIRIPSSSIGNRWAGFLGATAVQQWMSTLDYRVAYYDPSVDPTHPDNRDQRIYVFWHEYILFPLYLRGHCNLTMLLSRHRDADVLARVAYHLGFDCVRGSTLRGASSAVRELLRRSHRGNLTMTPDGPRGPRRQLALGPVYFASKLEMPLVVMGFGYDRPWRAPSWDRFAVPKPYSKVRAVVSPPITIPANVDRSGLQRCRLRVERLLNRLTWEAEAWAAAGTRKVMEQPLGKANAWQRWQLSLRTPGAPEGQLSKTHRAAA